ncbi:MAG TPA: amidase [Bryobacteraceae bacterium]|nr:amidase [Bryobacteraceae bacterium]
MLSVAKLDILTLSAVAQARLIRERKISARELVREHLSRIEEVNPRINAVTEFLAERALEEARVADNSPIRGPLHGVPFSIKDSIELEGTVCTAGTVGRRGAPASVADATLVSRLRDAGAIPIAKTNLPDLLFAFESDNLLFGRTNNPYDVTRTSGGSSGGEAALIAACGSPMGLGSDCAGSVRLPAAFCGIAGLKPTTGRLARTGHFPPSGGWIEALWQIGPMARRVEDLDLMMKLLAGADYVDHSVIDLPFAPLDENKTGALRIAWYTDNGIAAPEAEVADVVRSAANFLSAVEDRPQCLSQAYDLEMKLIGADGGDSLRGYLADLGSTRVHPLLTGWLDKLDKYRTDVKGLQGYWHEWDSYRAEMTAFLRGYDAIVCPVYTQPALAHGTSIQDSNFRGFSHTMAYNLCGLPAAVVRCGASAAGLPIAVQVVARAWREDVALAIAAQLEREFGGWKPPALERQMEGK